MKIKLFLLIAIGLCLTSICAHAQESSLRQIYNQAESEYNIGHIDQAIQLLQDNLVGFEGNLKQTAYRLLALCYLSEDREEEARFYAEQLVKLNNYYNSAEDPARFQDLINLLKEGITTTITIASSQSETINEAPAPITIITAEMIEELGYNKNLGQILAAYVPGMAEVTSTSEGDNLAMHSAYAEGQKMILIMENGHRLNTRFNNSGPTSYSISTEKIDHIEVLRGPASSLYGNVALSAVVNIITKSGKAVDGLTAKYGHATFNTHRADLTMGTQFLDADIFVWASLYKSDGQERHFSEGNAYLKNSVQLVDNYTLDKITYFGTDKMFVDGYKGPPAYDYGMTFRFKGFDLMFSKKNVKKVQQSTAHHGGYDYDRYESISGDKPGYGIESTHAEIGYSRQLQKIFLNASIYCDWYSIIDYQSEYDSLVMETPLIDKNSNLIKDDDNNVMYEKTVSHGYISYINYKERSMGGIVRVSTDYELSKMKGSILTGCQYDYFSLQSCLFFWGNRAGVIDNGDYSYEDIMRLGKEKSLSFFFQDKHYFLSHIIFNTGCRYDFKYRQDEDVVRSFSPRLSLMYVPHERFSLKLSYSEAFADLSFFNRYISKNDYYTTEPQHLSAIQLTAMGMVPSLHLSYEANVFYNRYNNLLCWQIRDIDFDKDLDFQKTIGKLTNVGIEGSANYSHNRLSANLTLYYSRDISSKFYFNNKSKNMVCGVPHFTLNLHGSWKLLHGKTHELKIYGHSEYVGRRLNFSMEEKDDFYVDGKLLFDLGVKYSYRQRAQLSLDCENIFDTDHYICGTNTHNSPYWKRGRTLMASLSWKF